MTWLSGFIIANLIGIGSNLDNTGIGLTYGIDKVKIPHSVNLIINLFGFLTALLGAYMGKILSQYASQHTTELISCVILCGVGLFMIYSAYIQPLFSKGPSQHKLQKLGFKQAFILGIGLSFSNIAGSFSTTISNSASLWLTVISITAWGYIMIYVGNHIGIGIVSEIPR